LSYDSDLDAVLPLLVDIAKRQQRVLAEPAPKAFVIAFADSGIDLELGFWVNNPGEGTKGLRSTLNLEIWREFAARGIEIPYPQRVVHVARHATPADNPHDEKNIV
jgi:small-conductance mechanosensitive channel